METLPVPLVRCTSEGDVVFTNPSADALFGGKIRTVGEGLFVDDRYGNKPPRESGEFLVRVKRDGREFVASGVWDGEEGQMTFILLPRWMRGTLEAFPAVAEAAVLAANAPEKVDEFRDSLTIGSLAVCSADRAYILTQDPNAPLKEVICSSLAVRGMEAKSAEGKTPAAVRYPDSGAALPVREGAGTIAGGVRVITPRGHGQDSPFVSTRAMMAADISFVQEGAGSAMLVVESDRAGAYTWREANLFAVFVRHASIVNGFSHQVHEGNQNYHDLLEELRKAPELPVILDLMHDAKNLVRDASATVENVREALGETSFGKRRAAGLEGSLQSLNEMRDLLAEIEGRLRRTREAGLQREPVDVNSIIRRVESILRGSASGIVKFHDKLSPGPLLVDGSKSQILILVYHLASNAVNAIRKAGLQGSITVKTGLTPRKPSYVRFEIADTGPGMDTEIRELFNGRRGFSRTPGGSGRGLLQVRDIVDTLGGSISLDTKLGAGARFTIDLPISKLGETG